MHGPDRRAGEIATPVVQSRLSVAGNVYFQRPGEQPEQHDITCTFLLESTEQKYGPREHTVTKQWQALDTGWVTEAGAVIVTNVEGRYLQVNPTKEEADAIAQRVIVVGYIVGGEAVPLLYVHPKCTQLLLSICDVSRLRVRCATKAKCLITTVPQ